MFGFFKINRPDTCPVPEDMRQWMEDAFMLLLEFWGKEKVLQQTVLTPQHSHFPIRYDGSEESVFQTLRIVAGQMDIVFDDIHLEFYENGPKEIGTGSLLGNGLFTAPRGHKSNSLGMYWGKNDQGKHIVSFNRERIGDPESMVAILAHELAHIKLLGEQNMDNADEYLTDLTTVFFGLGIFNANASFQTINGYGYRGHQAMGYFSQREWGYALALFVHLRGEQDPAWMKLLSRNVKGDLVQGLNFIKSNPEKIFLKAIKENDHDGKMGR